MIVRRVQHVTRVDFADWVVWRVLDVEDAAKRENVCMR
jgi:hypothetical protein